MYNLFTLVSILSFTAINITSSCEVNTKPIVLLHGIESHMENLEELKFWIQEMFDRLVYNLELGDGDDYSTDTPVYTQVDELKNTIYKIPELMKGFDFIGLSQGGLIGRAYVQLYNHLSNYQVNTLITLVTPHGGVYDKNLGFFNFYTKKMQNSLSFSNYWRNPNELIQYLTHSSFLADANNERLNKNETYKKNIMNLENFVMVYSPNDEIIKPPETGIFAIYDKKLHTVNLKSTELYKKDWLGLKYLDENNKLFFEHTNCTHVEHRMPICFPQLYPIFKQFL
jgi:palmitoyl-protein thioesterase